MRKNNALFFGLALIAFSSVSCFAADTVGDLKAIQAKTILAQAEAAQYKAEADRNDYRVKSQNPGSSIENTSPIMPGVSPMVSPSVGAGKSTAKTEEPDPVVRAVYGANGNMIVTLMYASGAKYDAVEGDTVPGNFKIQSISMNKVLASKNGRSRSLVFSDSAPIMPSAVSNSGSDAKFPLNAMPIN